MPGMIRNRAVVLDINPLSGKLLGAAHFSSKLFHFLTLGMVCLPFASSAVSPLTTELFKLNYFQSAFSTLVVYIFKYGSEVGNFYLHIWA